MGAVAFFCLPHYFLTMNKYFLIAIAFLLGMAIACGFGVLAFNQFLSIFNGVG
jgi:hypothetical protein